MTACSATSSSSTHAAPGLTSCSTRRNSAREPRFGLAAGHPRARGSDLSKRTYSLLPRSRRLQPTRRSFPRSTSGTRSSAAARPRRSGVYDNLGASCLDPTRDPDFTAHVYPCDHVICCSAGHGQWDGSVVPYGWASRMSRTVEATFRKAQDRTVGGLFGQREAGHLDGFVLPYLGMRDESLERDPAVGPLPNDFVRREEVVGYPTDFRAMSDSDFGRLFRRGEQLTHLLVEAHWPS